MSVSVETVFPAGLTHFFPPEGKDSEKQCEVSTQYNQTQLYLTFNANYRSFIHNASCLEETNNQQYTC